MRITVTVESAIVTTPRLAQVRGLFDLPEEKTSRLQWDVTLPLEDRPWSIGLITGPSGCGKSTLTRHRWPAEVDLAARLAWPREHCILDAFPATMPIKDVTALLSAVGFSSPPAWLRPFHVLSTGQQFRVTLARLLADALASSPRLAKEDAPPLVILDEYTSVVDRTVAQLGSAALARAVRGHGLRFVAVTCHEDVLDWLQPDWVYRPAEARFDWRCLQRRPAIPLEIFRCKASAWPLFAPHHYLASNLNPAALCFLATWRQRPVAFSAWLSFVGTGPPARREHRTVCLPDFQGVGIGNAVSATLAAMWKGLGFGAVSTTTHPAMIQARCRSPLWRLRRRPSLARPERSGKKPRHATTRLTAGFEYLGPALPRPLAVALLGR